MPDITNDFDNNPNTDERKQRDEDVNNDNLQPEQAESEPELLDQTKSKEFSIPIFAKLYDRCNLKIDELNLKNDKLNAKIEKLNIKKVRSAEFVSTVESMRNVVPMPVYKALSVLSAERRQKIVNINEKIHSHKLNIKSNEQKILKQQSRADNCKKINKFLDNMKFPDGRKENFVKGMQEYRTMAMRTTSEKFDNTQSKLDVALKAYGQTHYMSEKLKLRKQIDKLTNKKAKLINKLKALNEWSDKFESVKTMPDKETDNIISKSCQNIVDEFTTNPQALKKQADVIVLSAAKAVTEENYLKNAEMSIEDDYDSIDGIINNGNKQEEYDKAAKTPNKEHNAEKQPKQPKKPLISRSQIKQNADKIAKSEHREQDGKQNRKGDHMYKRKWHPSKSAKAEFKNKMTEIEDFCNKNGIDRSLRNDSYYFMLNGKNYRVSNHTIEASNAKAYDAVTGEKKRDLYHPDGREEDTVYITASKTRIIDIYNDLAAGYELDKRGNRVEKIEEPRSKAQIKPLISRSQIKQNADKIAHTHNEQLNNTKSKEQEL